MRLVIAPMAIVLFGLPVQAHEGHQPLPTRGVQVDLKSGHVTLSLSARSLIDVQTVEVEQRNMSDSKTTYANIIAPWSKYALVTSRLPGRVTKLFARPGDRVAAGQVLAEIDSLELHALHWDIQQAHNDLEQSREILSGVESATKSGAVAGHRLLESELDHRQNLNTLRVLESKVMALGLSVERMTSRESGSELRLPIRSPIDGVVVHGDLTLGKFVEPTEHLMDVVDSTIVWARIGVLERDLRYVAIGNPTRLKFDALPGELFEARIEKLGQMLDPQTQQLIVWAEVKNLENVPRIFPGMSAKAEVRRTAETPTLCIPREALQSDGAEFYVLVEESSTKDGSEFQKVAVAIGRQSASIVEIVAGQILPGDRVVTRGAHQLASLFVLGVLRVGKEMAQSIGLSVEPVSVNSIAPVREINGVVEVQSNRRSTVSSQLNGKIQAIRFDRGQLVKAGDVMLEVASLEFRDLQLELLRAHLDGALWRDMLARRKSAGESVPRRTLVETEGQLRTFETTAAKLRQKLLTLGMANEETDEMLASGRVDDTLPLRAPIAGTLVDFSRALGQVVRADEPLLEIHDVSEPWVRAFVSQQDSSLIRVGQTVRVRWVAFPSVVTIGTVARIGPVVNSKSLVQEIWIEPAPTDSIQLMHNMGARVSIAIDRPEEMFAVPLSALIRDGLSNYVFVLAPDGSFERRSVRIGRLDDQFCEIVAGLSLGESIATGGVSGLQTAHANVR